MNNPLSIYRHAKEGSKNAQFVLDIGNGFSLFQKGMEAGFSAIILNTLYLLLFPFLLVVFWLLTRKVNQEIAFFDEVIDSMKSEFEEAKIQLNQNKTLMDIYPDLRIEDYVYLKQEQGLLHEIEKMLGFLLDSNATISDFPWLVRGFMRSSERFYYKFQEANTAYSALFTLFDEGASSGDHFDTATEAELWERRNKAYNYLV